MNVLRLARCRFCGRILDDRDSGTSCEGCREMEDWLGLLLSIAITVLLVAVVVGIMVYRH